MFYKEKKTPQEIMNGTEKVTEHFGPPGFGI